VIQRILLQKWQANVRLITFNSYCEDYFVILGPWQFKMFLEVVIMFRVGDITYSCLTQHLDLFSDDCCSALYTSN